MKFFIGLHMPSHAAQFEQCMVSVNRLRDRRSDFRVHDWLMDSGAFTKVARDGGYREEPAIYADQICRWRRCGNLLAAASEDYMCEPFVLARTGLSIAEHQALTIARYELIRAATPKDVHVMPVLQGWHASDYVAHVREYASLLRAGMWVGVGSVCKRNTSVVDVETILLAIHRERPDLRLHGFGLKLTALSSPIVRRTLFSADSMAWSWHARRNGRSANDPGEAHRYVQRVETQPIQENLFDFERAA